MTEKDSLRTSERAIREILQHLVDYPDAKDTMEGILKWWLPGSHTWGRGEVQEALDFMTLKGWLTKRNTSPPQKIYGFNKEFIEEIRKFLIGFEKDKRD